MLGVSFQNIRIFAACVTLAAILLGGIHFGSEWFETPPLTDSQKSDVVVIPESPSSSDKDKDKSGPTIVDEGAVSFHPGADDAVPQWILLLSAGFLMLLVLVAMAINIWPRQEDHTKDSPEFTLALEIWHPLIRVSTNSPRQMKRFMNKVRYIATALSIYENKQQPSESQGKPSESQEQASQMKQFMNKVRYIATMLSVYKNQQQAINSQEQAIESQVIALATLQDLIKIFTPGNEDEEESMLKSLAGCLTSDSVEPIFEWLSKIPENSMAGERKDYD